jgi:hypothetical protein
MKLTNAVCRQNAAMGKYSYHLGFKVLTCEKVMSGELEL